MQNLCIMYIVPNFVRWKQSCTWHKELSFSYCNWGFFPLRLSTITFSRLCRVTFARQWRQIKSWLRCLSEIDLLDFCLSICCSPLHWLLLIDSFIFFYFCLLSTIESWSLVTFCNSHNRSVQNLVLNMTVIPFTRIERGWLFNTVLCMTSISFLYHQTLVASMHAYGLHWSWLWFPFHMWLIITSPRHILPPQVIQAAMLLWLARIIVLQPVLGISLMGRNKVAKNCASWRIDQDASSML